MTLAPGHFHAALVQKRALHGVHHRTHVYGPLDPDMRESLDNAAIRYGMTVELPNAATLQQNNITLDNAPRVNPAALRNVAAASNADLAVVGWLDFSEADTGWVARWSVEANGRPAFWMVRGVNYDEAFRNAMRASLVADAPAAKTTNKYITPLSVGDSQRQFAARMRDELNRRLMKGEPLSVSGVPDPGFGERLAGILGMAGTALGGR